MVLIKCPCCNHIDDNDLFFSWGADSDGHPTIDHMTCPNCDATTHRYDHIYVDDNNRYRDEFTGRFANPKYFKFDDFIELEEDEVDSEILLDIRFRYNQREEAERIAKEKDMQEWNRGLKSTK